MTKRQEIGASLIVAALMAPIVGISRDRRVVHAIDMEHVVQLWGNRRRVTTESVCGRLSRPVAACSDDGLTVAPWPPRVQNLPRHVRRCAECFAGCTEKRPRSEHKVIAAYGEAE